MPANNEHLQKNENKTVQRLVKGEIKHYPLAGVRVFVESIELESGTQAFLVASNDNKGKLSVQSSIEVNNRVYHPVSSESHPYRSYTLPGVKSQLTEFSIEDLYERVYLEVDRYVDIEDDWKHFITTCILFSYKQDKYSTTPYVFVVGDNESGKSVVLHLMNALAYRPLYSDSLPYADIYNFLGTTSEASGTILEDEVENLDKDREKLKIYKGGYVKGSRIPRVKESENGGTRQLNYWSFCLKVFAGEKLPFNKGFLQRCIVIPMVEGFPKAKIKEPKPDDIARLTKLRNDLLVLKMQTIFDEPQEVHVDFLRNRNRELWAPLLSVVKGSRYYNRILELARKQVAQKIKDKGESKEAAIFKLVLELTIETKTIRFEDLWEKVVRNLNGQLSGKRPDVFESEDFGDLSKTSLGKLLTEKFRGEKGLSENKRTYAFSQEILDKLQRKYLDGLNGLNGFAEGGHMR